VDPTGTTAIYREGIFMGSRGFDQKGTEPQYPFGYGLSYTSFAYSDLDLFPKVILFPQALERGFPVQVRFTVTNTGQRAGAETAQVYVGAQHPSVPRPPKELKGFCKVWLAPGQSQRVSVPLNGRALAYYDVGAHGWKAERGLYRVLVGASSRDIRLQGTLVNPFSSRRSVRQGTPAADPALP
jgi:beta-glucosidase